MNRPLLLETAAELEQAIERNRAVSAELELLLSELAFRKTSKAQSLKKLAKTYLAECQTPSSKNEQPGTEDRPSMTIRHTGTQSDEIRSQTAVAVAAQRAKLIDLSRRSPLINFRHSGRSATILRIVDERPDLLFDTICEQGMRFEPLPDPESTPLDEQTDEFQIAHERARLIDDDYRTAMDEAGEAKEEVAAIQAAERALTARVREQLGLPRLAQGKAIDLTALARANGFDPSYDLRSSDDNLEDHHEDDRLRVLLTEKDLQKRLKAIWDRYRLHYRETGIHTLYLAIGFVEWMEEGKDNKNYAPALLLGVEIERRIVRSRYEYTLRLHDDGLQTNIALAEKMREHWGLDMPTLRKDEKPESYFIRLRSVLELGRNLNLRQFVTLAVLPFPQMILWKDLDPQRWQDGAFGDHRLLPAVMGVTAMTGEPSSNEPYDIDANEWALAAPTLVRPADASQHSALIEVNEGADLAIEGPPGTGKSETITNMIADAVANGKKVLFVAEKQAALQVVGNRLKATGLGPLTLELHGENAKRADVYANLQERMRAQAKPDPRHLALQRGRLQEKRTLLRNYLAQLEKPVGALEHSAYNLVWREIHLRRAVPDHVQDDLSDLITLENVHLVDRSTMVSLREQLDIFGEAVAAITADPKTLWLHAETLPVFGQQDQLRAAAAAAEAAGEMRLQTDTMLQLATLALPDATSDVGSTLCQLGDLRGFDDCSEDAASAALRQPDTARSLLHLNTRWRRLADRIEQDMEDIETCDRQDIARLGETLAALDSVSISVNTVADVRRNLTNAKALEDHAQSVSPAFDTLARLLELDPGASLRQVIALCEQTIALDGQSASVRALLASQLLDPLSELAINEQSAAAHMMRVERSKLLQIVDPEAIDADPEELKSLADTLEGSGFFARLFGGEYKRAHRRATRLLRDTSQRMEAAEVLRQTAKLGNNVAEFCVQNSTRPLFPDILWKGMDSSFEDLGKARELLVGAKGALANDGLDQCLAVWLRFDSDTRRRIGELAQTVLPLAQQLAAHGEDAASFYDALADVRKAGGKLSAVSSALDAVKAKQQGIILRDGESLPARVEALDSCAAEFDRMRRGEGFAFIKPIAQPLESLGRALEHVDRCGATDDVVKLMPALRQSDAPVELLDAIIDAAGPYSSACQQWQRGAAQLTSASGLRPANLVQTGTDGLAQSWRDLQLKLGALADDNSGAREAADLLKYRGELTDRGMANLGAQAVSGKVPADCLADAYELHLTSQLLREFLNGDGRALQRAGGLKLADARKQFVAIDEELHELEAQSILAKRLDDIPPRGVGHGPRSSYTDMSLLENELGLKRPRTPLRDVVHRAGEAMQILKPVWMMSPTSAAQYIRPNSLQFDLLIVDEASQMRPEFALSAMLRADQFVVVGDANQLPPSDHFGTKSEVDDGEDDIGIDADAESILDVANQKFRRKRRLKWHYRSRHESLIKFSNREFYDDDLIVFPSPSGNDDDLLGAKLRYVPDLIPGTYYEASINQKEAESVLEEAVQLMIEYPTLSLGVAAMNAKQTTLLETEFDRLRLQHPAVDRYVQYFADSVDEFFIKNLENVQGDERDIILVSTVYGPDKDGIVKQNFGLMNREVGWRRLNVLVTRAKMSIRVFTSLRPGDVKVTPSSSTGITAFNAYLTYLNEAPVVDEESRGDFDSDFERVVANRLTTEGYFCVPQVGVNKFRIDIGVKHAACDGGFLAGIECDGAPYHSGFTVRDRDRIRQQVLEGLNWNIYRIWSVDWYADSNREMEKLLAWLAPIQSARKLVASTNTRDDEKPLQAQSDFASADKLSHASTITDLKYDEFGIPAEPTGKAMRPVDGIEWYEVQRGVLYHVWIDKELAGTVTVLSRGTQAPHLYGHSLSIQRSEYQSWARILDESHIHDDLYAAVRWVATNSSA